MTKTKKAVLLSGLVFPGAGHLYLKKNLTAMILIAVVFAALYFLFQRIFAIVEPIRDQIINGQLSMDVVTISEQISNAITATESQSITIATYVLIATWLFSIFDSFRIARSQKQK